MISDGSSNSKRICLAINSFGGGGAERVMVTLANKFHEWGYPIDYVVRDDRGPYKALLNPQIKKIILTSEADGKIKKRYKAFKNLWRYFRSDSAIVTMSTLNNLNILVAFVCMFSFSKTRLYLRQANTFDFLQSGNNIRMRALFFLMKLLYPTAKSIIANSRITRNDLLAHLPIKENKIIVIYNPLSVIVIGKMIRNTRKNTKTTIVACGSLYRQKNFTDLISAFPLILKIIPESQLIILGEGDERAKLQAQINHLGLQDNVKLEGFVENPYKYFASSHVFVQTSLWEGFGYVLVEAMACGTPVVAYDSKGAMREILQDGKYGKLVPVGDLRSLVDAIIEQIKHPTPSDLLNEAVLRFDVDIIAKEYLQALDVLR